MFPEIYDFLMLRLHDLNLSQLHVSFVTGILMTKLTISLDRSIQTLKALEHEVDAVIDVKKGNGKERSFKFANAASFKNYDN